VLNLGAGRAAWYYVEKSKHRRQVLDLKSMTKRYIGADIDAAVLSNPTTHENILVKNQQIPLNDSVCDLILSDFVLEHVEDVCSFEAEVFRLLKPGGWFCARTPHYFNYVSVAARLVSNLKHHRILRYAQPDRLAEDVFPTCYRCNSLGALRHAFPAPRWNNFSYLYTAEPSYYFGRPSIYKIMSVIHNHAPKIFTGNLFVFLEKTGLNQC